MGQLRQFLAIEPLAEFNQSSNPFALEIPPDVLKLQTDVCNVVEGRVDIYTFEPEYQEKIKNYYRFTAHRQNSKSKNIVKRNNDTLDLL
ncbi:hypothetical protein D4R86_04490 [bacterium]|nr:MAG: hypothetical protein D4R86_04490 [bacterium]